MLKKKKKRNYTYLVFCSPIIGLRNAVCTSPYKLLSPALLLNSFFLQKNIIFNTIHGVMGIVIDSGLFQKADIKFI